MFFKRKFLLLILFFIIIIQGLLYTNNKQRTSFRYFKWTVQEVSIGKLISFSFFSGLIISTLLKTNIYTYKKNNIDNLDENFDPINNQEDFKSKIEMPPQRDLRDSQPTISVNYRVVKNIDENNMKRDQNYSNGFDNNDDWDKDDNDW